MHPYAIHPDTQTSMHDAHAQVALHKLEMHGGEVLAAALSTQLQKLRTNIQDLSAAAPITGHGAGRARPPAAVVPEALSAALSSVHKFLLGVPPRRPPPAADPADKENAPEPGGVRVAAGSAANGAANGAAGSAAGGSTSGASVGDVERLGGLAKSVLVHINDRLHAAARQATTIAERVGQGSGSTEMTPPAATADAQAHGPAPQKHVEAHGSTWKHAEAHGPALQQREEAVA